MECTVERTSHRVDGADAVHGGPLGVRRGQPHRDVNPSNDEHAILGFDLAGHIRGEASAARIDLTRLQRASKGPEHSTGRGRDVDGRGVRFGQARRVDLVVLSDHAVALNVTGCASPGTHAIRSGPLRRSKCIFEVYVTADIVFSPFLDAWTVQRCFARSRSSGFTPIVHVSGSD